MKKDDVRSKIIEATNNGISLREIARYFGVSPTSVRRWRDGQRPKDPQNVLDGLSEMIGYAKDEAEPHEITVTFTPKFKIGDKVRTAFGDVGCIEKYARAGVAFDEHMQVTRKYLGALVKFDHGYEHWYEHWEEDGLELCTQPDKPKCSMD